MTDPDTIITQMAQQREQERAQDEAHYKLRKACQARAVELHAALARARQHLAGDANYWMPVTDIDQLLKEIDDATQ